MTYKSRRADLMSDEDQDWLTELHEETFGDTAPVAAFDKDAWWLVFARGEESPVAFAGVVPSSLGPGYAYYKRAGVMPDHRGHGLQRRLIRLRERWARKEGFHTLVTDVCETPQSANNLIECGFRLFTPETKWSLKGALYLKKLLS